MKAKALAARKLVYLEFYTVWCGPCKLMERDIFSQKSVGDAYNSAFVNCKMDAEKGEGQILAKQYGVSAYPTHLYIDPATEAVIYRYTAAPNAASIFIKQATTALQERVSPKSWESYTTEFSKRRKDTAFLREYLTKAYNLGKPNDPILDAYVEALQGGPVSIGSLNFLLEHVKTLDNRAVALLWAHHHRLDSAHAHEQPEYTLIRIKTLLYPTMEKAVASGNESLLDLIAEAEKHYMPDEERGEVYWYRHRYFLTLGDTAKAKRAAQQEADYIMSRPDAWYFKKDSADRDRVLARMRALHTALGTPEKDLDARRERSLARNPSQLHPYSAIAALWLNDLSMRVYTAGDTAALPQALRWSRRAMDLTAPSADFLPQFSDTHARLLFLAGKRDEAIAVQQQAITVARTLPERDDLVQQLEATLHKMQSGVLPPSD